MLRCITKRKEDNRSLSSQPGQNMAFKWKRDIMIYMRQNVSKKVLEYTVVFEPAEEGGYVAYVPALPGCVTQGDTFEEAVAMAKDAIEGYLSVLKEEGETVPQERKEVVITKVAIDNSQLQF